MVNIILVLKKGKSQIDCFETSQAIRVTSDIHSALRQTARLPVIEVDFNLMSTLGRYDLFGIFGT